MCWICHTPKNPERRALWLEVFSLSKDVIKLNLIAIYSSLFETFPGGGIKKIPSTSLGKMKIAYQEVLQTSLQRYPQQKV